jgi:hypothetical protein
VVEGKPRIRHPHQFEIKLRYALPEEQKKTVYDLAVYFFLPPSLGITSASYNKGNFTKTFRATSASRPPRYPSRTSPEEARVHLVG